MSEKGTLMFTLQAVSSDNNDGILGAEEIKEHATTFMDLFHKTRPLDDG